MTTRNVLTRSSDINISRTETEHNKTIAAPIFPVLLNPPFVRSETDPPGLERFLDHGDIPPDRDAQMEIASWCALRCIRDENETGLGKALSHLISTQKGKVLSFSKEPLTEHCVNNLIILLKNDKHKTIVSVALTGCNLNADQVIRIINTASIQNLNISNNNLGPHGTKAIFDALQNNTTIQCLCMRNNNIGPNMNDGVIGVQAIGDLLLKNTTLKELDLARNDLYSAGGIIIFNALKHNKSLLSINLTATNLCKVFQPNIPQDVLDPEICSKAAEMLRENRDLVEMNLSYNKFFQSGLFQIMKGLVDNKTLRILHLGYQSRDLMEIHAITYMLMYNEGLRSLNLAFSALDHQDAKVLSEALKSSSCTLASLDLHGNFIGKKGISYLASALKQKTSTLCRIDVGRNQADLKDDDSNFDPKDPDIIEIEHACQRNLGRANGAEAFLRGALAGVIRNIPGQHTGMAADIASFLDPWLAFESDLPILNKNIWQSANDAWKKEIRKKENPKKTIIENACKSNPYLAKSAEAFLRGALAEFIRSFPGQHIGMADDIASLLDPWVAFETNLPILNKDAWESANRAWNKEIGTEDYINKSPKKSILCSQFKELERPFSSRELDTFSQFRAKISRSEFIPTQEEVANINKNNNKYLPFLQAAFEGNLQNIQSLLEAGEDPNQTCHDGSTALLLAAENGHLPIVQYFIDNNTISNPHAGNLVGSTPIEIASESGHLDIVKFLIEKGEKPNQGRLFGDPDKFHYTPLMAAAQYGHPDIVKFLVDEQNISPHQTDALGWSPLMYAAWGGSLEAVTFFLDKKTDIHQENLFGSTPLSLAVQKEHLPIVELLIKHDADVNHTNSRGFTPLYIAAYREKKEREALISILIKHGANLDSDFHIEKETDLKLQCAMVVAIGRIWYRVLTAPTMLLNKSQKQKLEDTERTELEQLRKNAQTLIDRLGVMKKEALIVRLAAVLFASPADSISQSVNDHPYLKQLFDLSKWIDENSKPEMLYTLMEHIVIWDKTEENKWGEGKIGILNINPDQLPAITLNMWEKLFMHKD